MMRKLLLVCSGVALLAAVLPAQTKPAAGTETLKGYVVDVMCAAGIAKKANVMAKAAEHTRACCFHEACAASGFGMFTDGGKFVKFDQRGSDAAKKLLESSRREKGLYFEATGKMEGETFVVKSLKESNP